MLMRQKTDVVHVLASYLLSRVKSAVNYSVLQSSWEELATFLRKAAQK